LEKKMAAVRLSCEIDGCKASWSVASAKLMKRSMDQHRQQFHPEWVKPEPKPMNPYRLADGGRAGPF
jgi:hypothetical protein